MTRTYEPVEAADAEVVGLLANSALAVMTRLAKDGDQAPSITAHVAHARMSARAFRHFEEIELWAQHRGLDLLEVAGRFEDLFDDLDARTRPARWSERSVKTYVTVGIFGDLLNEVTRAHGLFADHDTDWDLGQGEWAMEHLQPTIAQDPQVAARLSLWARRVAGEVLGLVRSTLFTHPALLSDPDEVDAVVEKVTKCHGQRMADLGLQA
ncbi:tRNA 2-methylthio-N6-isopentenyl adenosine(37) hydroxylase MiaE-like protein [Schaalia sp. 19OD2882]|uniref:ferritin-like fold-containing protein n=1 Tax=Schaalia sp. 19OD2882 TaxID=2794089 RepID=UPI001C1EC373|nr:ferritin-like fold-containing protein [Schaalia sp. 19OD2882]QWW20090.1 tRNA 2-methylthio-N6-isopentenyl adenosine(37) hydroxylase MiaE-like protein [Schaalia sp. 19OD2882]